LLDEILKQLPEGEALSEDQVTDQPERFLAAEIIREKAIQLMYHEVPYALAVVVEKYEEKPRLLRIEAVMNVERDSQKKILIGHKGESSRRLEQKPARSSKPYSVARFTWGCFVKVAPDWRENPQKVRELDWRYQLEGLAKSWTKKNKTALLTIDKSPV